VVKTPTSRNHHRRDRSHKLLMQKMSIRLKRIRKRKTKKEISRRSDIISDIPSIKTYLIN